MQIKDVVAMSSVLIALGAFAVQQWRVWVELQKKDRRTENKLKILYLCQARGLTEEQIRDEYKRAHPTESVNEVEIRKSIYEMLVDETLVFIGDPKTYEVRAHLPRVASDLIAPDTLRAQQMQQQQQ